MGAGEGLYRPDSVTWKVSREAALLLGGGRALLMQLAHPSVAAGVAAHSDFQKDPLRRLNRTLGLSFTTVFGTRSQALTAIREINRTHVRVRGDGYSARDPDLLLWVHGTLVDSALLTYRTFVGPLTEAECESYYQESQVVGALLGIPPETFPAGWRAFGRYMAAMVENGPVVVSDQARELSRTVLHPNLGIPGFMLAPVGLVTAGLLPERLRIGYGLPWGRRQRAMFKLMTKATPALVARMPERLRVVAPARH